MICQEISGPVMYLIVKEQIAISGVGREACPPDIQLAAQLRLADCLQRAASPRFSGRPATAYSDSPASPLFRRYYKSANSNQFPVAVGDLR